jgi:hypothetical protein
MQFYSPIIIKFALGIICLIVQINLMVHSRCGRQIAFSHQINLDN